MNNLKNDEFSITRAMGVLKTLKILWFLTLTFSLLTIILGAFTVASLYLGVFGGLAIMYVFSLLITIGLGIALFVVEIIAIIRLGDVDHRFAGVNSGAGKILIIVGLFIFLPAIIGAFIASSACKNALEQLRSEDATL